MIHTRCLLGDTLQLELDLKQLGTALQLVHMHVSDPQTAMMQLREKKNTNESEMTNMKKLNPLNPLYPSFLC